MPRILIVDDHELMRMGIKNFMKDMSEWQVCGEAVNGEEAVAMATELKPDVVLMDVSMPVMGGVEAARVIRKTDAAVKIVLLSMHDPAQVDAAARAAGAGVDAFICKSSCGAELRTVLDSLTTAPATVPTAN